MLRYIIGFGGPALLGAGAAALLNTLYPVFTMGGQVALGICLSMFFFGLYMAAREELWKLFHPKPELPQYAIYQHWGTTAPYEYRIEELSYVGLESGPGPFPELKWLGRYYPVGSYELFSGASTRANKFYSHAEAVDALNALVSRRVEAQKVLDAKEKPGVVAAYTETGQPVTWNDNVVYTTSG